MSCRRFCLALAEPVVAFGLHLYLRCHCVLPVATVLRAPLWGKEASGLLFPAELPIPHLVIAVRMLNAV